MKTTLNKRDISDLAVELKTVGDYSIDVFDTARKTMSDIGENIPDRSYQGQNWPKIAFDRSLHSLTSLSAFPDICANLNRMLTELTNRNV